MGMTEFIANRFVGKTLCVYYESEAETITYDQAWSSNKEYMRGVVLEAVDDVIVLDVPNNGVLYIHVEKVVCFWEPPFDYHKAVSTSLTRRAVGARRKDV